MTCDTTRTTHTHRGSENSTHTHTLTHRVVVPVSLFSEAFDRRREDLPLRIRLYQPSPVWRKVCVCVCVYACVCACVCV